jgi:hypothetical protein
MTRQLRKGNRTAVQSPKGEFILVEENVASGPQVFRRSQAATVFVTF